jgi:hypothetical protein
MIIQIVRSDKRTAYFSKTSALLLALIVEGIKSHRLLVAVLIPSTFYFSLKVLFQMLHYDLNRVLLSQKSRHSLTRINRPMLSARTTKTDH